MSTFSDFKLPKNWPSKGGIEVKNLYLAYGKEGSPFLKNISFAVTPLEKVLLYCLLNAL
jgi:ABC-type multidrug transport system fused ATPase/permease subunit